jgi:NTP pyrophosphatase (non-canonical NTP hydrolase)
MPRQSIMCAIKEWSDFQFDNSKFTQERSISISYHLQKEVSELIEALKNYFEDRTTENKEKILEELADCYMLLDDCTSHVCFQAIDIDQAELKKLEKNKNRKWRQPDKHGVVEHIK